MEEESMYLRVSEGRGQESVNSFLGWALPQGPEPLANCANYKNGEVQKSRTAQGHLPSDVIDHPRGLLLADFIVNWRTPRESLKREKVLQDWLATTVKVIAANPTTKIRIVGYSDCAGNERNNTELRSGRAMRVRALLNQMLGNGAAWNSLNSKIVFADGAPIGDYLASNATVEGRAQNRGVLIESHRSIDMKPTTVVGCLVRPSQVKAYPLMGLIPNVPFDRSKLPLTYRLDAMKIVRKTAKDMSENHHKALLAVEAAHGGITALEIFEVAGILAIAAPVLGLIGNFLSLGAGCAQAAEIVAKDWTARGYSRGIVMGADGRNKLELKARFGDSCCGRRQPMCDNEKGNKLHYRAGLFLGYVHGRMLCSNQREWFWRDLGHRMGDQSHLGPSSQWSDPDWTSWYSDAAIGFRNAHLD